MAYGKLTDCLGSGKLYDCIEYFSLKFDLGEKVDIPWVYTIVEVGNIPVLCMVSRRCKHFFPTIQKIDNMYESKGLHKDKIFESGMSREVRNKGGQVGLVD